MNNCKEYLLDDLLAIVAIPVSDYNPDAAAWQVHPTIDGDEFSPTLDSAISIGWKAATDGGILLLIKRDSGKAKDDTSDSVAGRLHTVTVQCEVDDRDGEAWDHLLTLERTPSHLLLTFRGGQQAFVQATQDTCQCTVERDGSKTSVAFKVQNLMGMQLIV